MNRRRKREPPVTKEAAEERLYFAITGDASTCLKWQISQGANVNHKFEGSNQLGKSALHLSCETGHLECAKLLVEAGANLDPVDYWYQTPLMYSICTERIEMVNFLVEAGCSLDEKDRTGKTAVHYALGNSEGECLQALIDAGACLNMRNDKGHTPLWAAMMEDGNVSAIKSLLDAGCDVNLPDNRERKTPVQAAFLFANHDTKEYIRLLLAAGAELNNLDIHGHASMMSLIRRGFRDGTSIRDDDFEMARMLIAAGYHVNLAPSKRRFWFQFHGTALKMAVERGVTSLVQLLLEAGANPDIPDCSGATPLLLAVSHNRLPIVKLLLRENCTLEVQGEAKIDNSLQEMTPLECAVRKKHWTVARYLVWAGYDLRHEKYLLNTGDVPMTLLENLELWDWAHECAANPQSLLVLCRDFVRRSFGLSARSQVDRLPLPGKIKDFLLLKDLVG